MDINNIYHLISSHFRKKRMKMFNNLFHVNDKTKILDVGGTPFNWQWVKASPEIILLNFENQVDPKECKTNMSFIIGNGMDIDCEDNT